MFDCTRMPTNRKILVQSNTNQSMNSHYTQVTFSRDRDVDGIKFTVLWRCLILGFRVRISYDTWVGLTFISSHLCYSFYQSRCAPFNCYLVVKLWSQRRWYISQRRWYISQRRWYISCVCDSVIQFCSMSAALRAFCNSFYILLLLILNKICNWVCT